MGLQILPEAMDHHTCQQTVFTDVNGAVPRHRSFDGESRQRGALVALLCLLGGCQGPGAGSGVVPARYAFLFSGSITSDEAEQLRERLPYERIELEDPEGWFWPVDNRITLWRDGRATLEGAERHRGSVSIFDYGRLCYLLDHSRFASMRPRYALRGVSDAGSTVVRAWRVGDREPIAVEDYGAAGPIDLWAIQAAIRGVARGIRFDVDAEGGDPTDGTR